MSEKRCYSITEIQEILGICKSTAYALIKENRFRSILIGGKYMISKKSFDNWLDGEMVGPMSEERSEQSMEGAGQKE